MGYNVRHCSVYMFIYLFCSKGQKKPIFWFPDFTTDHKRDTTLFHCVTLQSLEQKGPGKARLLTFISPTDKEVQLLANAPRSSPTEKSEPVPAEHRQ